MLLCFVNAPAQIFDRLVPFVDAHKKEKIIIVAPAELATTLHMLYPTIRLVVPTVHPNLISAKTAVLLPVQTVRLLIEYSTTFAKYEGVDVYVFCTAWSLAFFYYFTRLKRAGSKITLILPANQGCSADMFKTATSFAARCMHTFAMLLGVPTYIQIKGGGFYKVPTWSLDIETFNADECIYLQEQTGGVMLPNTMPTIDVDRKLKVLFLCGEIHSEGADFDSVTIATNELKSLLDTQFPDSYAVKSHPRDKLIYGNMRYATNIIDPAVFAELLYSHPWQYVIGYYSESLLKAKAYTSATVISLINLYTWPNDVLRMHWQSTFSNAGVLMPTTFAELDTLLRNKHKHGGKK